MTDNALRERPGDAAISGLSDTSTGSGRMRAVTWTVALAVTAVGVLVTALIVGGGRPQAPLPGLPDAGLITGWGLPVARLLLNGGAVATVGFLLLGAALLPRHDPHTAALRHTTPRVVRWAAAVWAFAAAGGAVLTMADILGVAPHRLVSTTALTSPSARAPQTVALLVVTVAAGVIGVAARHSRHAAGARLLLAVAAAGIVAPLTVGHSARSGDHYLATTSLSLHVLAACLWVGGLVALLWQTHRAPATARVAVTRFSCLAAACLVVVAASGLVTAWTRLGLSVTSWSTTAYGVQSIAKAAALVAIALLGHAHRRRTLPLLRAGQARAFRRVAAAEITIMVAAVAVAVALSRTPPPVVPGPPPSGPMHGSGHPTLPDTMEAFTAVRLFTEWRPDLLVVVIVGLALAGYLRGVRHVTARGRHWPARRTAAAGTAAAVVIVAVCGGLGVYSTALLSVQITQLLIMISVVPLLITAAAPVDLARQVQAARLVPQRTCSSWPYRTARRIAAAAADPVNAATCFGLYLYALYGTALLEWSLRNPYAHLLTTMAATGIGFLLFHSLARHDTRTVRSARDRNTVLAFLLVVLAAFGTTVAARSTLLGGTWFADLAWTWTEPGRDQRTAATVIWCAIPVIAALCLGVRRTLTPAAPECVPDDNHPDLHADRMPELPR